MRQELQQLRQSMTDHQQKAAICQKQALLDGESIRNDCQQSLAAQQKQLEGLKDLVGQFQQKLQVMEIQNQQNEQTHQTRLSQIAQAARALTESAASPGFLSTDTPSTT
jgi:predicted  nucleic acid-binding Zn-ribbon protein